MPDEKRKYYGTYLAEETHTALIRMGTMMGIHPSDLGAEYIARGIEEDVNMEQLEDKNLPPELQIYKTYLSCRRSLSVRFQLRQIAASVIKSNSEELIDRLDYLCRIIGISMEEVMKEAQEQNCSTSMMEISDPDNIENAKAFLFELFKNSAGELSANDVYALGANQGFSKAVLRAAKDRMHVLVVRRSHHWFWSLPSFMLVPDLVSKKGEV